MPHDGPFGSPGRDSWRYSAEIQFLANRGYAVFQTNYRGSIGYGKKFYAKGFKELGGKIQQDITDGVRWLIDKKIANPRKIAIMGQGFGGYSGYYGVSNHPELYNCVVVQNGLINFLAYIKDVPPYLKSSVARMYEMIGDPEKDANKFMEISPVFHPDRIKAPLLIFQDQSRGNMKTNISELNGFIRELQRRSVPLIYKGPTTSESKPVKRKDRMQANIEKYTEIQKFLDHNMGVKR
jgi:dipeptidyl aminopeptidase/acylaminoacyl peptidase